jgi:hypothetical protein
MCAFIMFAHSTFSIKTEWMVTLSTTVIDVQASCGRNCLVDHILKSTEFVCDNMLKLINLF